MLHSFMIKNFRCFRCLDLASLARINLIAGMNNAGKTALLEAIFLHLGPNNPQLPIRINAWRGIDRFELSPNEVWGWLFFEKKVDESIELISKDKDGKQSSLQIQLQESETVQSSSKNNGDVKTTPTESLTTTLDSRRLALKYLDANNHTSISYAHIEDEKIIFDPASIGSLPTGSFLSTRSRFPREEARRFSKLEEIGRQDDILSTLRFLEPKLQRLTILLSGDEPIIHADVGIGRLIPLPLLGEGIGRLLSIVLAIANAPEGVVLIDEIENGLHYSVMVKVWQAIAAAAHKSNTQIFATTHSWECISAAHEAFSSADEYDFHLHRLDRIDNDIQVVTYDQEMLNTAILTDLEVR